MTTTSTTLQVYEHQKLRIGQLVQGTVFSKSLWQALAVYHEKHHGKYYQLIHQGVQFKQYVGIIQIGIWTIEILPKIDQPNSSYEANWQQVLMDMLQYCHLIKTDTLGIGSVRLKSNSILDIYFGQFLQEVEWLLREGMPRQYQLKESNRKSLKGRLIVPKQLRYNAHHPERFYTSSHYLQKDHLFNQIIHEALKVLDQLHLKSGLRRALNLLLKRFPSIQSYQWSAHDFERLLQQPTYQKYTTIIELARLILMNFSADIRYGKHQLLALLFDMNLLFEEYIYQQLKRTAHSTLKISRQRSIPFWQRRYIRPDIVVEMNQEKIVIDTKWKVLPKANPSIEDLKQMYIYCKYFQAKKGVLLYPTARTQQDSLPTPFLDGQQAIHCQILQVNVLEQNGRLKEGIGAEIIRRVRIRNDE